MWMKAVVHPDQSRNRVYVKFDPWEQQLIAETEAWPGSGRLVIGQWYGLNPPQKILAELTEVGTEGEFTLFRRPIDIARQQAWDAGDRTQVTSLHA